MHSYLCPDKSESPPGSWFGASANAGHISLFTFYDTARGIRSPEFCPLLIWKRGTPQFTVCLCIFWLSMFIVFSIHHVPVMNRHPAGPWYGKLDILWFMKRGVFISHLYSWGRSLAVNAFKTDSALLDSWIKAMLLIITVLASSCLFGFLSPGGFSVLSHRPVQLFITTLHRPLCVYDISKDCDDGRNIIYYLLLPNKKKNRDYSHHFLNSPKSNTPLHHCLHMNWLCLETSICAPLDAAFLSPARIWLRLTPGEFPLLG